MVEWATFAAEIWEWPKSADAMRRIQAKSHYHLCVPTRGRKIIWCKFKVHKLWSVVWMWEGQEVERKGYLEIGMKETQQRIIQDIRQWCHSFVSFVQICSQDKSKCVFPCNKTWFFSKMQPTCSVANAAVYPPNWATLKSPDTWRSWTHLFCVFFFCMCGRRKPENCWAGGLKFDYFSSVYQRQLFFLQICQFPVNSETFGAV